MVELLLDSVILIDHLNGINLATRYLAELNNQKTAISVITRAEILTGVDSLDKPSVKSLLDQFGLLIIDKTIADLAAELRQEHGWKLPDAFQAALATHHKIKLITRNSKDFKPSVHEFVEIPYQI